MWEEDYAFICCPRLPNNHPLILSQIKIQPSHVCVCIVIVNFNQQKIDTYFIIKLIL